MKKRKKLMFCIVNVDTINVLMQDTRNNIFLRNYGGFRYR